METQVPTPISKFITKIFSFKIYGMLKMTLFLSIFLCVAHFINFDLNYEFGTNK
jgi:hypothetical protein